MTAKLTMVVFEAISGE